MAQLLFLFNLSTILNEQQPQPAQMQTARDVIRSGVILSIALAIGLAFAYRRRIVERLNGLRKSVAGLARTGGGSLTELNGDEIATLDQMVSALSLQLAGAIEKEQAIADYAMDVICSLDGDGRFVAVSPAAIRLWGFAPDELAGRRFLDMVLTKDVERCKQAILNARSERGESTFENQMRCRDGSSLYMLWSVEWSITEKRLFCVGQDITARKELELLKQQFVALVSHELRTPLNSIGGVLSLLSVGALGPIPEKAVEKIEIAERNINRLMLIVNDLLDIEKLEAGQMQMSFSDISLAPLLETAVESVERVAEKEQVSIETASTEAMIFADGDRLVQVLVNLLGNAIKYSPKEAAVSISVKEIPDFVEVCITDRGKGIPASHREAIFERFRQVEIADSKKKGGTGLGLAICKAIVEQHRGSIGVDSEEGKGSTFWFRIPASRKPS